MTCRRCGDIAALFGLRVHVSRGFSSAFGLCVCVCEWGAYVVLVLVLVVVLFCLFGCLVGWLVFLCFVCVLFVVELWVWVCRIQQWNDTESDG
jgi:hypothetical protein